MNIKTEIKGRVEIVYEQGRYVLMRDQEPYFIKGIGGARHLDIAKASGANSLRTWSSHRASEVLDQADEHGMTVMLGISLSKKEADYEDEDYKEKKREEVRQLLEQYKDHPALLIWALGNEINLGTNHDKAWQFVEELAQIIKMHDRNHPVCTVLAGSPLAVLNQVAKWVPTIDVIGINAYAKLLPLVRKQCEASELKLPCIVTEYGPMGHWEVEETPWGAPIEENSRIKADSYLASYQTILDNDDFYLGSYVFLWGQKQERTPTWYGLFVETNDTLGLKGETTPAVDVMHAMWSGKLPKNQAPILVSLTLNDLKASDHILLQKSKTVPVSVDAVDLEGDPLTYVWEVLEEATVLGEGGSFEPRPKQIMVIKGNDPTIQYTPEEGGNYRLFVYVLDGQHHVATANVPFQVKNG